MTIKEKPVKERLIDLLEQMDEAQLLQMEKIMDELAKEARIKRQLEALHKIAGIITDPEEVAALEEATQRRPYLWKPRTRYRAVTYTLDTNALTALLTGRGNIGERFLRALSEGDRGNAQCG